MKKAFATPLMLLAVFAVTTLAACRASVRPAARPPPSRVIVVR
jgi:hypothetical protein